MTHNAVMLAIRLLLLWGAVMVLSGCSLPFARTYSLNYGSGDQTIGASVHFDAADPKIIKPPQ